MRHKYPKSGPDCAGTRKEAGASRNEGTMSDPVFKKACGMAKVKLSRRQASKWNNRKGAAYAHRFNARNSL